MPATCGVAMEVPLIVLLSASPVFQDEVMLWPGAKMSTHPPKLENEARASVLVVAPTVMASAARAGEVLHASLLSLPAAIAYTTPAATERRTASSSARSAPPPRLMLATAGFVWLAVTQSMPATTPAVEPEPEQLNTRTAYSITFLATPKVLPPTVPATCVPWPLQSLPFCPSLTASWPTDARPPNSLCEIRMPVSMMYACAPLPCVE